MDLHFKTYGDYDVFRPYESHDGRIIGWTVRELPDPSDPKQMGRTLAEFGSDEEGQRDACMFAEMKAAQGRPHVYIRIFTENADFSGRRFREVARILKELAIDYSRGTYRHVLADANGNTVGSVEYHPEPKPRGQRKSHATHRSS